jgi:Zn-dependent protease
MSLSLNLGRLFGINLFIHWSFWLLPLWVTFTHLREGQLDLLGLHLSLLVSLFACVVLHEYGHALTARRFGIDTHDITLYPIGGVARLERLSERPFEEFCIALAGPLVNVIIAFALGSALFVAGLVRPGFIELPLGQFAFLLLAMNLLLIAFNMIPAFPMDGGRVLRAILASSMELIPATRIAVAVGTVFAVLLAVAGPLWLGNPMLVLVGLFVIWAGRQELYALQMRERQREAEAIAEAIPMVTLVEPQPLWHRLPVMSVTVFEWDAVKNEWVRQLASGGR